MVPEGCNPCRSAEKYPERRRERFLTDAEFARLGRGLHEAVDRGSTSPVAAAAVRVLMLTGCRKAEVLTLRWSDVDLEAGEIRLGDANTGGRAVPLAPSAVRRRASLPRDEDNPWVIVGKVPGSHLTDLQHLWRRIRARAELPDVRIHDLRHSCAAWVSNLPFSLIFFFFLKIRNQIGTGLNLLPDGACRA